MKDNLTVKLTVGQIHDLLLANSFGGDANYAATVAAALATKAAKTVYATKGGNYTALATDNNAVHRFTAVATAGLTAAATLASGWKYTLIADGGDVTIDPNGSETVNGQTTLVIPKGSSAEIICDGSNFFTIFKPALWESIGVYNPSGVASVSITDLGAFRFLRATGILIPSAGAQIAYRTSSNNGSSYDAGASDYTTQTIVGGSAAAGAAAFTGTSALITTQTSTALRFDLDLGNFNVAVGLMASSQNYTLTAGGQTSEVIGSQRTQATARNALQFLALGGPTLSGRIHLEGIRG